MEPGRDNGFKNGLLHSSPSVHLANDAACGKVEAVGQGWLFLFFLNRADADRDKYSVIHSLTPYLGHSIFCRSGGR